MSEDPVLPPDDDDPLGIEGSEELAGPDPVEASPEPVAAAAPEPDELVPIAEAVTGELPPPPVPAPRAAAARPARPDLTSRREPLYRECQGYRLRLDPPDLARLRELPGSRGKTDDEIGEAFFDGQAERLAASIVDDVPAPSEIRVVVDPYSRQAFLALENRIRGILSF
jgi:hypothetical protein